MDTSINKTEQQLEYIQHFLINIAHGDYNAKLPLINENEERLIAIQVGINMLVEELKETTISKVFLDSIYNGINDVLIVLNANGEIQKINHVVEVLLLYTESELLQQPVGKLIQTNDADSARNCIRNAYEQQRIQETGLNFIAKDKSVIPVACSFSPLFNAKNESSGILLVAKNMSTLINAKNQLRDKNDELNLFVYKASHDLKSPVTAMMSLMTMLNDSKDIEEMRMYNKMMNECINKLDTIIADLLVLGRITYGELEYTQVDIKELIHVILKSIEFMDGYKDIIFDIIIDEQAQSIVTEKGLFQTILLNLIDNAIKYRQTRADPSYINIHVSKQGTGILLKIDDNGIGIAAHLQGNIFKMFYRATSASKGSGLGLYIVKTSILKLGGTISLESNFDKGTTFKVYLPNR